MDHIYIFQLIVEISAHSLMALLHYIQAQWRDQLHVMFQCDDGYSPTEVMNTTCTSDGSWLPNPTETTCSIMVRGTLYNSRYSVTL